MTGVSPRRALTCCHLVLVLVMVATSARPGAASTADRALRRRDWSAAVPLLEAEAARSPRSAGIQRKLGVALYGRGSMSSAVLHLEQARRAAPHDRVTLYFLGRAADAVGNDTLALAAYRALLARSGRMPAIRARVDSLAMRRAAEIAREALRRERRLRVADIPTNTISVPEFAVPLAGDSLAILARGLSVFMLTDLEKVPQLDVLERERLGELQAEIERGEHRPATRGIAGAGAITREYAPRTGLLLGARRFAQGYVLARKDDQVQIGVSLIDVVTGAERAAGRPQEGPLPRVVEFDRALVYQVLDTLQIRVDDALRRRLGPVPTYPAFLAYCRGLDFESRGLLDDARREYDAALKADPSFELAADRADALSADATGAASLETTMFAAALADALPDDRLMRGAAMAGMDGGADPRDLGSPADSRLSPAERVGFRDFSITVKFP